MTVLDNINFFGAAPEAEAETEEHLARTIAEPLDAVATTFRAFELWERAYIEDVQGNADSAVELSSQCLETVREARSKWKQAEQTQAKLVMHMLSYPQDVAVRPEVRQEFERLPASEHVRNLQDDDQFVHIPIETQDSVLDLATSFLPIEDTDDEAGTTEGDAAWEEIMRLFRLDQRMTMKLKTALKRFERTVRECKSDIEQGQLFEANQYETHRGTGIYPVAEQAARVRSLLVSYMLFKETYGTFITNATATAEDALFPEVAEYVTGVPEQDLDVSVAARETPGEGMTDTPAPADD